MKLVKGDREFNTENVEVIEAFKQAGWEEKKPEPKKAVKATK